MNGAAPTSIPVEGGRMLRLLIRAFVTLFVVLPIKLFVGV